MAVNSLAIVGRDDKPVFVTEFPSKYHWKKEALEEELFGLNLSDTDSIGGGEKDGTVFDCSLKQQFILHTALDRFVQVAGPPPGYMWRNPGATGSDACFVGLLCPIEDLRCYGYVTATKIKIFLVVEDDEMTSLSEQQSVDERIKTLMAKIHEHYIEYTLNPFTAMGEPIQSKRFSARVEVDVEAFNRSVS